MKHGFIQATKVAHAVLALVYFLSGGLSVSVEGPSKVEMSCTESGDGACRVTYYPMVPGEYTINLKFMDKPISGSPYVAKITG